MTDKKFSVCNRVNINLLFQSVFVAYQQTKLNCPRVGEVTRVFHYDSETASLNILSFFHSQRELQLKEEQNRIEEELRNKLEVDGE